VKVVYCSEILSHHTPIVITKKTSVSIITLEILSLMYILRGKPEGRRPLGRPRCRWMDNIEIGWGGMDWIDVSQDRNQWRALVKTVMNVQVP
jgi:hypothetical protein